MNTANDYLPRLQEEANNLSSTAGIYQMFDKDSGLLYVGKARNLKRRITSYFCGKALSSRVQSMVNRTHRFEVTVVNSESEALLLEQNLIKERQPHYNVLLRDDKSYPYLYLSDHSFPRLAIRRNRSKNAGGEWYGPYPMAAAVRASLYQLQQFFRLRSCSDHEFKQRRRPCLEHQIGRCSAPCTGLISKPDYQQATRHARMFLAGRSRQVVEELNENMEQESACLNFEKAARLRDDIGALNALQHKQIADSGQLDADVIATSLEGNTLGIHMLYVRQGRVIDSRSFFTDSGLSTSSAEGLAAFIGQFYLTNDVTTIPQEIIISEGVANGHHFATALSARAGRNVILRHQVQGERFKLLNVARNTLMQNMRSHLQRRNKSDQASLQLAEVLAMSQPVRRMECFDVSHTSGSETVASCVVFQDSRPLPSAYRTFIIKDVAPGDDYAALEQALTRRYERALKEEQPLPDILILDGGKGQLKQAQHVVERLALNIPLLLAIAKGRSRRPGRETLHLPGDRVISLPPYSLAFHLLQHIRDEAHRTAIRAHRNRRGKRLKTSLLETIPGIGPARRHQLLSFFGGSQRLQAASVEELQKAPGIGKQLANTIYRALNK